MNLQERLDLAREHRRRARGLDPTDDRPVGDPDPAATLGESDGADVDLDGVEPGTIVDVTGTAPAIDLTGRLPHRSEPPRLVAADHLSSWSGAAVHHRCDTCPSCGGAIRLDLEDAVGQVDHFSCDECGLLFQVPR